MIWAYLILLGKMYASIQQLAAGMETLQHIFRSTKQPYSLQHNTTLHVPNSASSKLSNPEAMDLGSKLPVKIQVVVG